MHTAKRAIRRLALIGWLGVFGCTGLSAQLATAATPPERVLPDSTIFFLKVNDVKSFREAFRGSQYGQLWNDPAMKDFKDDLIQKVEDATKSLKDKLGISLKELIELPQGSLVISAILRDDPKLPVAVAVMADAGENKAKMADVLGRATKQAEEAGAKTSQETFNGLTLHVVQAPAGAPKDKGDAKEKGKDEEKATPPPPIVWTQSEGLFLLGSDIEAIKDLTAHREGRDNSLASNKEFAQTQTKIDAGKAQVLWFLDLSKLINLVVKLTARGNEGQAQQNDVLVQEFGVKGLKSVGGSFTLGAGNYDGLSKTFFLRPQTRPGPAQGLLVPASCPATRGMGPRDRRLVSEL